MPLRYVVAGLVILGLLRLFGSNGGISLTPRYLTVMAELGLVGVTLNQVGYTVGLSLTSGSHGALIFATAPVWELFLGIVLGSSGAPGGAPWGSVSPWLTWPSSWVTAWAHLKRPWVATCAYG